MAQRLRRLGPLAVTIGIAAIAVAQSDDGDPLVVSPRQDLGGIQFTDYDLSLELEYRRNRDRLDANDGPNQRDVEDRFREILEGSTRGFVGHPNLLELDLGGRLWFEQRDFDADGDSLESDQTLYEWNANGRFFKESILPFTIYSRQNISDIDRQFGGTLENTFRETGARFNFRGQTMPTNVRIYRREIDQDDPTVGRDFTIDQDTVEADGRVVFSPTQRLAWDLKYDDIEESGEINFPRSFDRFESNATHTLEFGHQDRSVLRTRLRLYDESGDRLLRQIRVDPRLRVWHSENLTSWYDYSFGRDDRADQQQTTHRATANVQHQLFDSLTTIGTVGYEHFDLESDDFDQDETFVRVNSEYLKQVPGGRLAAGLQGAFSRLDQSERGTPLQVSGQIFVFNDADLIIINERNIVESSIRVASVNGLIVYDLGIDYLTRGFPDRVEIQRIPGGSIAPNQAVMVDYTIGPDPGGRTDTTNFSVDLRYTLEEGLFRGLSAYGQYTRQDESRSIIRDDFPENDFDEVRYGLDYTRNRLYLRAEAQHRTGSFAPFDAVRLEGRFTEPLGAGSNLVISGIFQEIDRENDDIRTTNSSISGQWNQRFNESLRIALVVQYQWTDDNVGFDVEGFEQQFDANWRRGSTEVYFQIRNSIRDTNTDDTDFQRIVVGIRRDF